MTKPTRSQMKEARDLYEEMLELNELFADVKLIADKIETVLGKIADKSCRKETEYFEYISDFDEEKNND